MTGCRVLVGRAATLALPVVCPPSQCSRFGPSKAPAGGSRPLCTKSACGFS
ncbi:hypothetical protein BU14_1297s0003 [Porphyra umbilicalis]|uniref:Uncharacterized protein n=1 Tax=Porphyra umbilicalis TaxID=2786 RepID=A0A1X6NMF5_PORUM|nr:hypothetical protein BU14_1297s0003 [Porphyra umbilicalis]|eukprot:OSX69656.1 hypothetical protein BU14_1297s0003 [Porphyra umbilicalis]